ncbi:Sec-independent protein translocase protein TatB [Agarilytica rhodophyticola]|uniref:Sec-independent protein translocase protein TatB n=1 Tax=Agarilytica rhodophyticola TaxID=1737490 RepID=UPI000B347B95|nr:Sec-independent protein translocase protein TatB [Agarilytica rhodophyticola]
MGFAELVVIAIVGLIVVGPDRLPEALKTGLVWVGRVKRMISSTRVELEQQLGVDEIRREIHNEQVLDSLKALKVAKQEAEQSMDSVNKEVAKVGVTINENFGPEDDGVFGDQSANHPPQHNEAVEHQSDENRDIR